MKRRDTIRNLYLATAETGKLAMANSRPDDGAPRGDLAGAEATARAPSDDELAAANSRATDAVNPANRASDDPAVPRTSPEKLAMANSQEADGTEPAVQADGAWTDQAPSPEKLAMANSHGADETEPAGQTDDARTDRELSPRKLAMANSHATEATDPARRTGDEPVDPARSDDKLAMANSRLTGTGEPANSAGDDPAVPVPSPEKLAMANSQGTDGAEPAAQGGRRADQTLSPQELAVANSRMAEGGPTTDAGDKPAIPAPSPEKLAMANSRSPDPSNDARVLAGPVRAMSLSLRRMEDDRHALQEALARGETIVEIDPSLIDPSFIKDRLDHDAADFAEFKRLIEVRGQEVAILVRPHPKNQGRFQVAYGHRRLRALTELGRHVRAVIRPLTDDELVTAQGLENSARQDLTYIEKALFARRLEDHGFDRTIIIDALSTDKGELSKLITVARAIPESIVTRIGPAPKAGRRRWLALAEQMKDAAIAKAVGKAVKEEAFEALDTDARFVRIASIAAPQDRSKRVATTWEGQGGRATAQIARQGTSVTLSIDRDPAFGEFVAARLDELYATFLAQGGS